MAGSYSDVPSRRMGWDDDGTRCFGGIGSGPDAQSFVNELTDQNKADLNSQDPGESHTQPDTNAQYGLFLIFPELREVDGMLAAEGGASVGMYMSGDSTVTNIFGSGWTELVAAASTPNINGSDVEDYRTEIVSTAISDRRGVGAVKTSTTSRKFVYIHVYGEISPGETPDKLVWIDENTGLEFTKPKDYGDIPRGGSEDIELRLKNESLTLTANTVQYTVEALGVVTSMGGGNGWFTATLPGGSTYQATNQIGSIASNTTTGIITLRRITPGDDDPRLYAPRIYANTASWS